MAVTGPPINLSSSAPATEPTQGADSAFHCATPGHRRVPTLRGRVLSVEGAPGRDLGRGGATSGGRAGMVHPDGDPGSNGRRSKQLGSSRRLAMVMPAGDSAPDEATDSGSVAVPC